MEKFNDKISARIDIDPTLSSSSLISPLMTRQVQLLYACIIYIYILCTFCFLDKFKTLSPGRIDAMLIYEPTCIIRPDPMRSAVHDNN